MRVFKVRFSTGAGNFFITVFRTILGPTQPPIQREPGVLSLGVKRLGREADHSPPYSAKMKNECSYTSTSQYVFMARCLVKHRNNFTFHIIIIIIIIIIISSNSMVSVISIILFSISFT
jgi:hypothetical protein